MEMAAFNRTAIAFVTGAGSGIGRATCVLLAEQGATVVAVDINKSAADQTVKALKGGNHLSVHCDVAKTQDIESAVSQVKLRYKSPPNIAVNCAGIVNFEPLSDITEERFDQLFNTNVKGTVWVTKTVCRELLAEKKTGSIVNISSISSNGEALFCVYGGTKGAITSFTLAAAKELGPQGIRVNVVSPGGVDTPVIESAVGAEAAEVVEKYSSKNPMKRLAKPQEVAEAVVFLASEKASYITGTNLYVHGGHI